MGKMSELAAEFAELKHCGEVLIGISEMLTEMFSGGGCRTGGRGKSRSEGGKEDRKEAEGERVHSC